MRLLPVLLALLFAALPSEAHAAPDAPPTPAAVYAEAVSNLKHSHDYARCVQQLQYLTARDSANRDTHLALGCAEADRAVSLGYAALWTKMLDDERAKYPQSVADWQAAQRDPKSDTYGNPRPTLTPLRTFVTKDDDHPFLMPVPEAIVQVNALARDAQAQWARALALSPTQASRAEAEYVQGWGISMLRLLASNNIEGSEAGLPKIAALPTNADAVSAFQAATKDAPTSAAYWQSLGDAQYNLIQSDVPVSRPDALKSYKKSLVLQPKNAMLWYRVYQLARRGDAGDGKANSKSALPALQHVVDSDPGNAYPHYLMASLSFHQTHYSDPHDKVELADRDASLTADYDTKQQDAASAALAQIEQGNTCPHCTYLAYQPPYPAVLSGFGIWANLLRASDMSFFDYAKLRELARACGGYARIAAAHGDVFGMQRGARACVGMGMSMAGDWPIKDKEMGDSSIIAALTGIAVSAIGYGDLVRGEGQVGDTPAMQQVQAEYDAFKQRQTAYKAALQQNLDTFSTYDYY